MKKFTLIASVFILFSCGNSNNQQNGITEGTEQVKAKTQAVEKDNSDFGKVTEIEPEKSTLLKKIILADPYEFKERHDNGSTVIDVRSAAEFGQGHISGAINIPISDPEFSTKAVQLMSERPILVYSQKGIKSQDATHLLETAGFKKIFNLEGGYEAWVKTGL